MEEESKVRHGDQSHSQGTIFPFGLLPPPPGDFSLPDVGSEPFRLAPDTGFVDYVVHENPKLWSSLGESTRDESTDMDETNPTDRGSKVKPKVRQRKEDWGSWLASLPTGPESDPALARARRRNSVRLRKANEADWSLISKYLPSDVSVFFPFAVEGPDDYYQVDPAWVARVIEVARAECPTPDAPLVKFSTDPEAYRSGGFGPQHKVPGGLPMGL
jgi:hypothetical protein